MAERRLNLGTLLKLWMRFGSSVLQLRPRRLEFFPCLDHGA